MNKYIAATVALSLPTMLCVAAQKPQLDLAYAKQQTSAATEGIDFSALDAKQQPNAPGAIEVVEIFSYGYGLCYLMEPHLAAWLKSKPSNVNFIRIHAVDNPVNRSLARLYYTLQALGRSDLDAEVFNSIFRKTDSLASEDEEASFQAQLAFAAERGIDPQEFSKTYHSLSVTNQLQRSRDRQREYGVTLMPALIVGGRYRLFATEAGREEKVIAIVDNLVKEKRMAAN